MKAKHIAVVATVLTACGIETIIAVLVVVIHQLQQCLPLAVLKLYNKLTINTVG